MRFQTDLSTTLYPYGQQENDDVDEQLSDAVQSGTEDKDIDSEPSNISSDLTTIASEVSAILPDNDINARIRSFNVKQREIFDVVHRAVAEQLRHRSCDQ